MINRTFFTSIASGGTVSDAFSIGNAREFGIWAPLLTTCSAFLLAAYDPSSPANFIRVTDDALVGDWAWPVNSGGKAAQVSPALFPHYKIETSAAQADTRTFAIHVKL